MSKYKRYWYWCCKGMIQNYRSYAGKEKKSEQEEIFYRAIKQAKEETKSLPDGEDRLKAVDLVIVDAICTREGAALRIHVSSSTIRRWTTQFIYLVGKHAGYEDETP